jgi:hypothetical protein
MFVAQLQVAEADDRKLPVVAQPGLSSIFRQQPDD